MRLAVSASAKGGPGEPNQTHTSTAEVFPVELKDAQLKDPCLTVSKFHQVRQINQGSLLSSQHALPQCLL